MNKKRESQSASHEHLVQTLPLPPTVEDILQTNPELSPIQEGDFQRVEEYFATQVEYYQYLAENEDRPDMKEYLEACAARIPTLMKVIRENTRLITEPLFYEALRNMQRKVEAFIGNDQYLVFVHGETLDEAKLHSTYFVAEQLGLPLNRCISEAELKNPNVRKFLKAGGKVVIVDDATYSSQNISNHLRDLQGAHPELSSDQLLIAVVGSTTSAAKRLLAEGIQIEAEYQIPELRDFFEENDARILRFMERRDHQGKLEQITPQWDQVLTLFWQKVPDNFCYPLRKWYNRYWDGKHHHYWPYYLVDDLPKGIHPAYRQGKTFMNS